MIWLTIIRHIIDVHCVNATQYIMLQSAGNSIKYSYLACQHAKELAQTMTGIYKKETYERKLCGNNFPGNTFKYAGEAVLVHVFNLQWEGVRGPSQ